MEFGIFNLMGSRDPAKPTEQTFAEVAEQDGLQISLPMARAIMMEDNGPAVAYHLGQNPEEAARIAAIPDPLRQTVEMGKIFAALAPATEPRQQAQPSKAPPPVNPLRRSASPAVAKTLREIGDDPDGMAAYAAERLPQLRSERLPGGTFGRQH